MTNGDKIRAMSNKELAILLIENCATCSYRGNVDGRCYSAIPPCTEGIEKWLEEECNEVTIENHKLKEAAKLIRNYCEHTKCSKCIFDYYGDCMFVNMNDPDNFYHRPWNWEMHAIGHGRTTLR